MKRNKNYFSVFLALAVVCVISVVAYFYVAEFAVDQISKSLTLKVERESDYKNQISYTQTNTDPTGTPADFDLLAEKYGAVISAIEKGYAAHQSSINIFDHRITPDELHDVVEYLSLDHGYYYVERAYNYTVRGKYIEKYNPEYFWSAQELGGIDKQIDEAANSVAEEAAKLKTDIEKLIYIHDHLVGSITYGAENYDRENNLYGALILKNTLCTGYSEAFSLIASKVGIKSWVVTSKALNHAWNIVLLEGRYYFVDCAWDDPVINDPSLADKPVSGSGRYQYFMCSEDYLYNNDHRSEDWLVNGINVSGLASSRFYDEFFWRDYETLMTPAGGSWYKNRSHEAPIATPNQVKFSIDKITFSGNENYTIDTQRTVRSCWLMTASYYPIFISTLQSYNGAVYYMRADGIYKLGEGGDADGSDDACVFKNPRNDNIFDFCIDKTDKTFTVMYGKTMDNNSSNATKITYNLADYKF